MALTQRFGLTHFGLGVDGSLSDDGGKFTGRDRRVIDRILSALEEHKHEGGARLEDPDFEPTLTLDDTQGSLPAGATFHYRVSFIDQYGLETAAGTETSIQTFSPVESPDPPLLDAVVGGSLPEGLHYYAFTGHSEGGETVMSSPALVSVSDWRTVNAYVAFTLPTGTDAVSVWRQGPLDSGFTRLATVPIGEDDHPEMPGDPLHPLFVDDGSIASSPENPPLNNFTNSTNSVEVEVPPLPPGVHRWRIYRTRSSGQYGDASLVAEVVETSGESSGELVETYLDKGEPLSSGKPLDVSQTLSPSRLLEGGGSVGGGGSGRMFVSAPDGALWRLGATLAGDLETRPAGLETDTPVAARVLTDEASSRWRVTITDDGELETVSASTQAGSANDIIHEYGQGPHITTSDPNVTWRLGVSPEGELLTEGSPVSGLDLVHLLPVLSEPDAPSSGGVLYFQDGQLRFKNASDNVTVLA